MTESGIAGVLRLDGAPLDAGDDAIVQAMGAAMAHRFSTATKVYRDGAFAMVVPTTAGWPIGFDGRARGAAAIPSLYAEAGERLGERIDGPFALALWDAPHRRLLLVRDRFGIRPLFTALVAGGQELLFASELKALLVHPRCPRQLDWVSTLAREAMPRRSRAQTSLFLGTEPLPAGTLLMADARSGRIAHRRWYTRPTQTDAADARSDADIIAGYGELLDRAVQDALGEAPERVGLMLSGGIDSVGIAALAARTVKLPTFTVLGQSTFGNGDAGLAQRAAAALGLPSHQVLFRVDEPISPDDWRRLLWLVETPTCAFQHYYKFHLHRFAQAHLPTLTTMLNGEGSDELSGADFRNQGEERSDATFADYLRETAHKQREEWHTLDTLAVEHWLGQTVFSRAALEAASGRAPASDAWRRRVEYCIDALEQDVSWRDDRLAAGCGLRSETPFLDHRLVEYVLDIPPAAHARLFWEKHLLRTAMKGIVPELSRNAPKIPFFAGVDARFSSRLLYNALVADDRALVREAFDDDLATSAHAVLAPGIVETLLDEIERDPQRGAVQVLLPLVNLGLLGKMARDAAYRPGPAAAIPALSSVDGWDETAIAEALAPRAQPLDRDTRLSFASNAYVVRPDTVGDAALAYIVVDDEVRYVLDEPELTDWRQVLRRIDGQRTLGTILDELGLTLPAVQKHIDEAIAFAVLVRAS